MGIRTQSGVDEDDVALDLDQKRADAQGNGVSRRTRRLQDLGDFVGGAVDCEDGAIIGGREVGIVQRERGELPDIEFRRGGFDGDIGPGLRQFGGAVRVGD